MFANTKVKIAAGLATGALTLGAAGAYAANNGSIPATNLPAVTITGAPAGSLQLVSTTGKTTTLALPTTFKNQGQCVSLFAQHQDVVLKPAAGTARISKNSHGKLMSSTTIRDWCKALVTKSTTTDTQTTETPDATESAAPSTDSADTSNSTHGQSGQAHGNSQGHGRSAHNLD